MPWGSKFRGGRRGAVAVGLRRRGFRTARDGGLRRSRVTGVQDLQGGPGTSRLVAVRGVGRVWIEYVPTIRNCLS